MINPFSNAAEFLSKSAHRRQKILDATNRVSRPFHSVVRGIEDPSLKESIVQAIGRQTEGQQKEAAQLKTQTERRAELGERSQMGMEDVDVFPLEERRLMSKEDPFASKQLYDRAGLVEFGDKLLSDMQKMSFTRTTPALTQETDSSQRLITDYTVPQITGDPMEDLKSKMLAFVQSARNPRGHTIINGIHFAPTLADKELGQYLDNLFETTDDIKRFMLAKSTLSSVPKEFLNQFFDYRINKLKGTSTL